MAEESKNNCNECSEIDYFIDYTTYNCPCKNTIDLNNVTGLDKPKLNRNNRIFTDEINCISYNQISYDDWNKIIDMNTTKIPTEEIKKCSVEELHEKLQNIIISER